MTSPSPSDHNAVAAAQARAARGLLGWSQTKLAEAARVSLSDVELYEASGSGGAEVAPGDQTKIRAALEAAGVEFLSEDSGGAGVRFRRRRARQTIAFEDLNASNDE